MYPPTHTSTTTAWLSLQGQQDLKASRARHRNQRAKNQKPKAKNRKPESKTPHVSTDGDQIPRRTRDQDGKASETSRARNRNPKTKESKTRKARHPGYPPTRPCSATTAFFCWVSGEQEPKTSRARNQNPKSKEPKTQKSRESETRKAKRSVCLPTRTCRKTIVIL